MSSDLLPDPHKVADGHLPAERLAALADEPATVAETRHLGVCTSCAGEVESYRALLVLSRAERDRLGEPLTAWPSMVDALATADMLASKGAASAGLRTGRASPIGRWGPQAAAAALFLAVGLAVGRYSAHSVSSTIPGAQPAQAAVGRASNEPITRLVSDTNAFGSTDEALKALTASESQYRHAVAYLMQADTAESPDGYQARLAALSNIEQTMTNALQVAPNDPVLNQGLSWSVAAQQTTQHLLEQTSLVQKAHRY